MGQAIGVVAKDRSRRKEKGRNHPTLVSSTLVTNSQSASLASTSRKVSTLKRSRFGEMDGYNEIRQIGSGGFGNCFLLERKTDKVLRVCKVQQRKYCQKLDDYEDAPIEASILRDILPPHDRILRLHEMIVQTHTVQLYYDFYDGGDLNQLIDSYRSQSQQIPEEFLWHAYQQISEALAYIHHGYDRRTVCPPPAEWTSIIHGDIKDKNIFLGPPDRFSADPLTRVYPSLVLGDFGLADLQPSRRWGTPVWQAPELPMLSKKSDVWGAGAVIHALAHEGRPPILELSDSASDLTFDEWCENPDSRQAIPLVPTYSHDLQDCVFSALDFDPMRRFNSYQLYSKVTAVYNVQVAPHLGVVMPLLPPATRKKYNTDGITLKIQDSDLVREQEMAAKDAIEDKTFFEHGKVVLPYEISLRPAIAVAHDDGADDCKYRTSVTSVEAGIDIPLSSAAVGDVSKFGIDPTEWFIEPGEGMYVFGTEALASSQSVKHEAGSSAFPVDPTGWFICPGSDLYVFGSTRTTLMK